MIQNLLVVASLVVLIGCNERPAGSEELKAAHDAEWQGNYELAIELFGDAIEKNPEYGEAFKFRGWRHHILALSEDITDSKRRLENEAALRDLTQAIRLGEDCYDFRAAVHQARGNKKEAESDYNTMIKLLTKRIERFTIENDYSNRASCYEGLGQYDLAIEDLKEAFKLDPEELYSYRIQELKDLQEKQK